MPSVFPATRRRGTFAHHQLLRAFLFPLAAGPAVASAQDARAVAGRVTGQAGEPLQGAAGL